MKDIEPKSTRVDVWSGSSGPGPEDLREWDAKSCAEALRFGDHTNMIPYGWSKVAIAELTIYFLPTIVMVNEKAKAIKAEITKVRADSENEITRLQKRLNNLLALEYLE